MKHPAFLNLAEFTFHNYGSDSLKLYVNVDHILSIKVASNGTTKYTIVSTTNGSYTLVGDVASDILHKIKR